MNLLLKAALICMLFLPLVSGDLFATAPAGAGASSQGAVDPALLPDVTISVNEIVASGFSNPVQVTHAGDGSNRLFVVEQKTGLIRIIKNGAVLPDPFLNIKSLITTAESEQGFLGLAFHPDYENNGYFYVNYTRAGDGATVIARYSVSDDDPDAADPGRASPILEIPQPFGNHNGGQILFGPDGYFYIGTGDGGSGNDPGNRAQRTDTLLGKMLRIDVDTGSPYTSPPDNPFSDDTDALSEIWATGLRNPWRFSFDRLTGDLYIGDVGQGSWEEVDYQAAGTPGGLNFGWRCKEGTHDHVQPDECDGQTLTDPIAEYGHDADGGFSITGGFVYRGQLFPALAGRYFYADFISSRIWSIYKTGPTTWSDPEFELAAPFSISSFGEDEAGELYVVDWSGGTIRRLADITGPGQPTYMPLILKNFTFPQD